MPIARLEEEPIRNFTRHRPSSKSMRPDACSFLRNPRFLILIQGQNDLCLVRDHRNVKRVQMFQSGSLSK